MNNFTSDNSWKEELAAIETGKEKISLNLNKFLKLSLGYCISLKQLEILDKRIVCRQPCFSAKISENSQERLTQGRKPKTGHFCGCRKMRWYVFSVGRA